MALLEDTPEGGAGAALGGKLNGGKAGAVSATYQSGINISKIMPEYRPRNPVFKLMSRPNFMACRPAGVRLPEAGVRGAALAPTQSGGLPAYAAQRRDEAPHLALKESNPFSLFSEASIQKDLRKNPIFSLPNPYKLASEKNFKLSGWQEVLGNVTQQLIAGEDNAAPESDRSKVGNTDTSPAAPVKKKKHG